MTQIAEKLKNLLTVPIKSEGYELLDVEYNKHGSNQTVQLFIDSIIFEEYLLITNLRKFTYL